MNYEDRVTKEYVEGLLPKMAFGSYVGTGTYGEDHPNSLTFDFAPKLVIIRPSSGRNGGIFVYPQPKVVMDNCGNYYGYLISIRWEGNTVLWSNSGSDYQLNAGGTTYYYFALG